VTGAQIADFWVRDDKGARVSGISAGSGRSNGPVQRRAAMPTTSMEVERSGPRVAAVVAPPRVKVVASVPPVHPAAPDDCRSDCGSSSSVVDDNNDNDCVLTSSFRRKFLPFDLNLSPPMDGDDCDLRAMALCL
jgi:EREBP-like factor